jgi:hypothetical protein
MAESSYDDQEAGVDTWPQGQRALRTEIALRI